MSKINHSKRYTELDSLRGIAALTVVLFHFISRLKIYEIDKTFHGDLSQKIMYFFKYTPLRIFSSGHEAVILFFILSGFVLSLPFYIKGKRINYLSFIEKRIYRIYIPYFVVIICAIILKRIFYSGEISELSSIFNNGWVNPENEIQTILSHFIMVGNYDTNIYNGSIWSLVHEMRISIIFPFIAIFCKKYDYRFNIIVSIILSVCSYKLIMAYKLQPYENIVIYLFGENIMMTMHYISLFIIGSLLAKHRIQLVNLVNKLHSSITLLLFWTAILFFSFPSWGVGMNSGIKTEMINDWVTSIGSSIFIVMSISGGAMSKVLNNKILRFMGQISYSLYLWHVVVLYTLIHALHSVYPIFIILPLAFVLSILIAWLGFKYIEQPNIKYNSNMKNFVILK